MVYNRAVKLWRHAKDCFDFIEELLTPKKCMGLSNKPSALKKMWAMFWGAHQRFFKYLTIAAKLDECVKICRNSIREGKCVVIGLQSTGEARSSGHFNKKGDDQDDDFVSTAGAVFQDLVDKHFPDICNPQ